MFISISINLSKFYENRIGLYIWNKRKKTHENALLHSHELNLRHAKKKFGGIFICPKGLTLV